MHSLYDFSYIIKLQLKHITKLLKKAQEKETEDMIFELWKSMYPFMMSGNMKFISYSEYKNKLYSKDHKYSQKTNE